MVEEYLTNGTELMWKEITAATFLQLSLHFRRGTGANDGSLEQDNLYPDRDVNAERPEYITTFCFRWELPPPPLPHPHQSLI